MEDDGLGAITDTQLQMKVFERAVALGFIPWLKECRINRRNARLGKSLVDYLLECDSRVLYLEVKSAGLRENHYAMYPNCPSLRGRQHMDELTSHVREEGQRAIVFIAAMPRIKAFKPYQLGDPKIHELLLKAPEAGVTIKSFSMHYDPNDSLVYLNNPDLSVALQYLYKIISFQNDWGVIGMESVLEVNASNWEQEVLQSDILTVVDFWHDRCPWCIKLNPVYDEVAEEYGDKTKFVKRFVPQSLYITVLYLY